MINKIKMSVIALLLVLTTMMTNINSNLILVHAKATEYGEVIFGNKDAVINISANSGQSLIGKDFRVYQLFYVENSIDNDSVNYTFHESSELALKSVVGDRINKDPSGVLEYEVIDYIQSLNNKESEFRFFVEELRDTLNNLNSEAGTVFHVSDTKSDGSIHIKGLEYGYYIIDEVSDNNGSNSASSLCMVSTANPEAAIKIKSDYPWVEKKIQEDGEWCDVADYEIGQTIPYKFTSNVPNMNGYDTYYYAWHDRMDKALTLDMSSFQITIYEGEEKYTLSELEYQITEGNAGESFVVEINDMKEIVDSHFNHIDEFGHNTYGQKILLEYEAVLNDDAAKDTGKPGYKNEVRLEFSNDPDSDGKGKTGFTPWDTVVCYTYKLNVLKINDSDQPLKGAIFRLFRDEDCKNEVFDMEYMSDEKGVFTIVGLDSGTYYLKETKAPDGYRVIRDPIKIEISATLQDGNLEDALTDLKFSANIKSFYDGILDDSNIELDTDVLEGAGNLTVVNKAGTNLPVTGSSATLIMIGLGTALVALSSRRKKHN